MASSVEETAPRREAELRKIRIRAANPLCAQPFTVDNYTNIKFDWPHLEE